MNLIGILFCFHCRGAAVRKKPRFYVHYEEDPEFTKVFEIDAVPAINSTCGAGGALYGCVRFGIGDPLR